MRRGNDQDEILLQRVEDAVGEHPNLVPPHIPLQRTSPLGSLKDAANREPHFGGKAVTEALGLKSGRQSSLWP